MNTRHHSSNATSRSSFVSRARYTSPMPPSPILAVTAYGPRVVPGSKGIDQFRGTRSSSSWCQLRTTVISGSSALPSVAASLLIIKNRPSSAMS